MALIKLKNGSEADQELVEAVWSIICKMSEMTYLCVAARARAPHLFESDEVRAFFHEIGIDGNAWEDKDIINVLLSTIGEDDAIVHPRTDSDVSHRWVAGVLDTQVQEIPTGVEGISFLQIDD